MQPSDHDLLLRVDEKLTGMAASFSEFKENHESRLAAVERKVWVFGGILAALEFAFGYLKH